MLSVVPAFPIATGAGPASGAQASAVWTEGDGADTRARVPDGDQTSRKVRFLLAAASCALVAVPFLSVTFPPITDLPQHAAQVRLFLDALHNPDSLYRIQWLTPYSLSYTVLWAAWAAVSP